MNYYIEALKKYATFSGRARRMEYWVFFLVNMIISFGIGFVSSMLGINLWLIHILATIYSWAILLPSIAVCVRRMHDVNKSGWYSLVPIYNLVLLLTEGDAGKNQYGGDPKGGTSDGEEYDSSWTCPKCNHSNPGSAASCLSCNHKLRLSDKKEWVFK